MAFGRRARMGGPSSCLTGRAPRVRQAALRIWVRGRTESRTAARQAIGTGGRAAVSGYRVAGKTGTAQKVDPVAGGYSSDRFVAVFEVDKENDSVANPACSSSTEPARFVGAAMAMMQDHLFGLSHSLNHTYENRENRN